ncbi:cytochrome b/b6 domain-containing protein [Uliginosibacterium sp. sgz301328]|uniref:cytochrome b/b6 domain-containing protein n=1 Tax=Uliginosibacterium sp. sgz301328 TaxID=3243764 RepID=UPI00359D8CF2
MKDKILVWDWPTRVFHWLLVACFAGSWITSGSDRYLLIHVSCGYTIFALMVFRLLWGLAGSRHARFASFLRGPGAAVGYVRSLLRGPAAHFTGHNPAGGWAIALMIVLGLITPIFGWITYNEWTGDWAAETHETLAWAFLILVGLHLLGVIVGSVAHRENLAAAMLSGFKRGDATEAIPRAYGWLALVMLIGVGLLWWWSMSV